MKKTRFQIWPDGKGDFYFLSDCMTWYARRGLPGNMVLKNRKTDEIYIVKGKMPEVIAEVERLNAAR